MLPSQSVISLTCRDQLRERRHSGLFPRPSGGLFHNLPARPPSSPLPPGAGAQLPRLSFRALRDLREARPRRVVDIFWNSRGSRLHDGVRLCLCRFLVHFFHLSSSNAFFNSSSFGAAPCHFGLFSMNETPLPLTVFAMMHHGPFSFFAFSKAGTISLKSWPSISMILKPKDLHRSVKGSILLVTAT